MPTDPNLLTPLVLAGAALALVGALRLARIALPSMPFAVAVVAVVAGAGVGATGVVLDRRVADGATPLERAITTAPPATPGATPPAPDTVAAEGRIVGTVRRASGEPVAGTTVVLRAFERTEETSRRDAVTDDDGTFAFDALPMGPTVAYTVSVEFAGTTFRSGLVRLDPHVSVQSADLVVAESTIDDAVIAVSVDSLVLVEGEEGVVQVLQILNVSNDSGSAYTGGLRLPILDRATSLDPRAGLDPTRLSLRDGELWSSAPVMPGTTEIVYTYVLPLASDGIAIVRTVRYPTGRFQLLVGPGLRARAPGLAPAGKVRLGAPESGGGGGPRDYDSFGATDLRAGTRLTARVGPPSAPWWRIALLIAAIVAAVGAVAYPIVRRRRPDAPDPDAPDPDAPDPDAPDPDAPDPGDAPEPDAPDPGDAPEPEPTPSRPGETYRGTGA